MGGKVGFLCLVALCLSLGGAFVVQSFTVGELRQEIRTLQMQKMGEAYKVQMMQQNIEKFAKKQKLFQKK